MTDTPQHPDLTSLRCLRCFSGTWLGQRARQMWFPIAVGLASYLGLILVLLPEKCRLTVDNMPRQNGGKLSPSGGILSLEVV